MVVYTTTFSSVIWTHLLCWTIQWKFYLFQDVEGEDLARTKTSRLTDHELVIKAAASLSIHWLNSVGKEAVVLLPVGQTEGASGQDQDFGSLKLAKEFGHQGYIVEPFLLMWLQRPMAEQSIVRQLELCPTHKHTQHTSTDTHTQTHTLTAFSSFHSSYIAP